MSQPAEDTATNDQGRSAQKERSRARQNWPIRKFELGAEPLDDLSQITTQSERFAMVWPLTLQSFALAGRPVPDYKRSETPGKLIRSSPET